MTKITLRTALELISHEAIVREAYKDSVGIWTWSIGITSASGYNVNQYISNPQPMDKCLEVFVKVLQKYADDVDQAFTGRVLSEEQFAAALSFHYNTGAIKRASWVKSYLAGNYSKSKSEFMNWRKPPEIIPRRQKERDLFFDGKWSNNGTVTEFTTVRKNGSIDWSSGKRVNVTEQLEKLFEVKPVRQQSNLIETIVEFILELIGQKK